MAAHWPQDAYPRNADIPARMFSLLVIWGKEGFCNLCGFFVCWIVRGRIQESGVRQCSRFWYN